MKRPNVSQNADRALWNETTAQEKTILRSALRALRAANADETRMIKTTARVWDSVLRLRRGEEESAQ